MTDPAEIHSPLTDHLDALRHVLIQVLGIIAVGIALSLFFYPQIFNLLTAPIRSDSAIREEIVIERIRNPKATALHYSLPPGSTLRQPATEIAPNTYLIPPGESLLTERVVSSQTLTLFGPLEGISTVLSICFWVGVTLTSPFWLIALSRFIAPGLRAEEKRLALPFLCLSALFMGVGAYFAFAVTIPLANQYLWDFNDAIGQNLWSLNHYVNYSLFLIFSNAIAFEIALVLLALVHIGALTADAIASKRKGIIIGAFVLGALLTPPDVPSQLIMAILLIAMVECAIVYAKWKNAT